MTLALVLLAAAAALWLLWRRGSGSATSELEDFLRVPDLDELGQPATEPDGPLPFGYKSTWLAVKAAGSDEVLDALPLTDIHAANWEFGFRAAFRGWVFVTPPIEGWVFVLGGRLPEPGSREHPGQWRALLEPLAARFPDVHYFGSHRVVGWYAWARFLEGRCVRLFAYLGEAGEVLVDRGERTPEERELGPDFAAEQARFDALAEDPEPDRSALDAVRLPDEEDVVRLAGAWSLNPACLEELALAPSVGWIGRLE